MAQTVGVQQDEQLVVFRLAQEFYGMNIGVVQEIINWQTVVRVPRSPAFVEGIINLRGRVIPVIDLRKRFELKQAENSQETRIVVVEFGELVVGLVVDEVSEVLQVSGEQIEPPSGVIVGVDTGFIRGVAKTDRKLIILVDADRILDREEQTSLSTGA